MGAIKGELGGKLHNSVFNREEEEELEGSCGDKAGDMVGAI